MRVVEGADPYNKRFYFTFISPNIYNYFTGLLHFSMI